MALLGRLSSGLATMVVLVLMNGASQAQNDPVRLRALGTADTKGTIQASIEDLAREMGRTTGNRATIEVASDAPDAAKVIDALKKGEAAIGWVRLAEIADLVPTLATLSVPFLFAQPQNAIGLLSDTRLGPLLDGQLRKQGLEPLAYLNAGALRLAGSSPDALAKGQQPVTIRPGKLRLLAFQTLGLEPKVGLPAPGQPLPAGLVELRTDDLAILAHGQGQMAIAEAPHAYDLIAVLANRDQFEALQLDIRETLRARAQAMAVAQQGATMQSDTLALSGLRQAGVETVPLPAETAREAHGRVKEAIAATLRDVAEPSILNTLLAYAD